MRSKELNSAFNRALIDPQYRRGLLSNLRRTLLETGVPEGEIRLLERRAPTNLEGLANALEEVHLASFGRGR